MGLEKDYIGSSQNLYLGVAPGVRVRGRCVRTLSRCVSAPTRGRNMQKAISNALSTCPTFKEAPPSSPWRSGRCAGHLIWPPACFHAAQAGPTPLPGIICFDLINLHPFNGYENPCKSRPTPCAAGWNRTHDLLGSMMDRLNSTMRKVHRRISASRPGRDIHRPRPPSLAARPGQRPPFHCLATVLDGCAFIALTATCLTMTWVSV